MSGIVGLIQEGGNPVDRRLLSRLTRLMADRGPDGQQIWASHQAGLGHTYLQTTPVDRPQPHSLDGQVWLVADARLDGRAALIQMLTSRGQCLPANPTDPDLILHAYLTWGTDCAQHLLGDFAFAIWDQRQQQLFCARDHFGVKPFYYTELNQGFLFSNTLNCVRAHPEVSSQLHDLAIADFLVFGYNQDVSTTVYQQIRRLPPAHSLIWNGEVQIQRYWTLPVEEERNHRHPMDCVEEFQELLTQAVGDRLGSPYTSLFMSGGLDSGAIAVTARQLSSPSQLQAITSVYDRLIPDQERHYAGLVAESLGIPIHYIVADEIGLYDGWDRPELQRPEPIGHPLLRTFAEQLRQASTHGRVALTGEGGDPVFLPSNSYFLNQLKAGRWGSLLQGVWQYYQFTQRLPPLGLRTQFRRWRQPTSPVSSYPTWLHPELRSRLQQRQLIPHLAPQANTTHPTRPEAYATLLRPTWPTLFEAADPGVTRYPVEVRHPLFDRRVVTYLLSLPTLPWFVQKALVRVALRGKLPETVRRRPKTPLAGNPVYDLLQQAEGKVIIEGERSPYLAPYLHPDWVDSLDPEHPVMSDLWPQINRLSFVRWCDYSEPITLKLDEEYSHEVPGCHGYEEELHQPEVNGLR